MADSDYYMTHIAVLDTIIDYISGSISVSSNFSVFGLIFFIGCLSAYFTYICIFSSASKKSDSKTYKYCNLNGPDRATDHVVYQRMRLRTRGEEDKPVFPNGWIPVLASKKVKAGRSVAVTALGQDLAVFRGRNGTAYVLDGYCPHLGAHIAVGGGSIGDKCIECPFHGWIFDGATGVCISIPYTDKVPSGAKIKSWPTREKFDFIFIWYHSDGLEPSWELPQVEEMDSKQWKDTHSAENTTFCHIQDIMENSSDFAHFTRIHSIALGKTLRKPSDLLGFFAHDYELSQRYESGTENSHICVVENKAKTMFMNIKLSFLSAHVTIRQIGPALIFITMKNPLFQVALLHYLTPEGPYQQKVTQTFFCNWRIPSLLGKMYMYFVDIQFDRDIIVWNNKRFLSQPLLLKEEGSVAKHRRWYSQFYTESSPTLKSVWEKRIDW